MLNEIQEVKEYIDGKNITQKRLYRICYLLAKWYAQQGKNKMEIRQEIFAWGKKYDIYINQNVNNIIYTALNDKRRLRGDDKIYISRRDIDEINKRFDNKKVKLTALAILCYAKCFSNDKGEVKISLLALGHWLGIDDSYLSKKVIKEILDFDFMKKLESTNGDLFFNWGGNIKSKSPIFKLLVPVENNGDYCFNDNDIAKVYNDLFT